MSTIDAPRRIGVVECLIAAVCAATLAYFPFHWFKFLGVFWDVSVYQRAVADFGNGLDPYRTNELFPFLYHPLVLRVLVLLNSLVSLKILLPTLTAAALAWFSLELTRVTRRPDQGVAAGAGEAGIIGPWQFLPALVVGSAFGGIAAPALMSGNLTPLLDFTLLAALLRGRFAPSVFFRYLPYALILLFSLVKPYLLVLLTAPVLLYQRRTSALACAGVVVVLFGLIWFSFRVYWPQEYAQFLANLNWHILGRGDRGYTFFFVFDNLTRNNVPLALALHGIVAIILLVLVERFFKQRYAGREAPLAPHLLVLYLALTLANPRMKEYDLFPALVGFFAVFAALSRRSRLITLGTLLLAAFPTVASLVSPQYAANHQVLFDPFGTWQMLGLALLVIALVVGVLEGDQRPATVKA